jgi:hypothetical protein
MFESVKKIFNTPDEFKKQEEIEFKKEIKK